MTLRATSQEGAARKAGVRRVFLQQMLSVFRVSCFSVPCFSGSCRGRGGRLLCQGRELYICCNGTQTPLFGNYILECPKARSLCRKAFTLRGTGPQSWRTRWLVAARCGVGCWLRLCRACPAFFHTLLVEPATLQGCPPILLLAYADNVR